MQELDRAIGAILYEQAWVLLAWWVRRVDELLGVVLGVSLVLVLLLGL